MKKNKTIVKNKTVFKEYFRDPQIVWIYNDENFKKEAKKFEILNSYKNIDKLTLSLLNSDEFKFKRKILDLKIKPLDFPEPILDGLETNIYSEKFFLNKYKNLKHYNFEFEMKDWNKYWDKYLLETKNLLQSEDNWILFEGCFEYKGYKMRPDILIKENGRVKLIEVKACSFPKKDHAFDLYYQYSILKALNYDVQKWDINLCTLNKEFSKEEKSIENSSIPFLKDDWKQFFNSSPYAKINSSGEKLSIKNSLEKSLNSKTSAETLFVNFFNDLDSKFDFESILEDIEKIQLQDEIQISNKPITNTEEQWTTLSSSIFTNSPINPKWKDFGGSYYLPYLLSKAGLEVENISFQEIENDSIDDISTIEIEISDLLKIVPKIKSNSVFNLAGDSGFNFKTKANLFNLNIKNIDDVPEYLLLSKEQKIKFNDYIKAIDSNIDFSISDEYLEKTININNLNNIKHRINLNEIYNAEYESVKKKYSSIINKQWLNNKIEYPGFKGKSLFRDIWIKKIANYNVANSNLHKYAIGNLLENKNNLIIQSFLKNEFPKRLLQKYYIDTNESFINEEKMKEYAKQYKDKTIYMYDFETLKNAVPRILGTKSYEQIPFQYSLHVIEDNEIFHYEWIANEQENFYQNFWIDFADKMFKKHRNGIYVSYNKAFEKTVMKNFLENNFFNFLKEEKEIIKKIHLETIDLMDPFKKRWFYHKSLLGSYSIKVVGKKFASELDYANLKNIKKGDQAAKEAKFWIMQNSDLVKQLFPYEVESKYFENHWKDVKESMLKYCNYDTLSMVKIFENFVKNYF